MKFRFRGLVLPLLALLIAAPASPATAQAAPPVLATIKPVHSLVAAVMAGAGTPELMIGGERSEHNYEMKPSDAQKIVQAKVIFWIGPDLETFMTTPVATLGTRAMLVTLETAPGVKRLRARHGGLWQDDEHDHAEGYDPHIWLDPQNAVAMTRAIAGALAKADPANAARYQTNAVKSIAAIEALQRKLAAALKPLRGKPYIVFHDAYHYFEARFGLSPAGAVTIAPGRPVGPRRIAALRQEAESRKALCIFREPQFAPRLVDTIEAGTGIRVGVLDPLGADIAPGPGLYGTVLERLSQSLIRCLDKHT
jgi:zinc transport system substrate-binding protein